MQPTKRRRGRPRKNPISEEKQTISNDIEETPILPGFDDINEISNSSMAEVEETQAVTMPGFDDYEEETILPGFAKIYEEESTMLPGFSEEEDIGYDNENNNYEETDSNVTIMLQITTIMQLRLYLIINTQTIITQIK